MRRSLRIAALLAACLAGIAPASGQSLLDVQLRASGGQRPLAGVEVVAQPVALADRPLVEPSPARPVARSDADGRLQVDLAALARLAPGEPATRLSLRFAAAEYEARTVHLPLPAASPNLVVELVAARPPAPPDDAILRVVQAIVGAHPNVLLVLTPGTGSDSEALSELARAAQRRLGAYSLTVPPPPLALRIVDTAQLGGRDASMLAAAGDAAHALGAAIVHAEPASRGSRPATRFVSTFVLARAGNASTRWHVVEEVVDDAARREAPALLPEPIVAAWTRFAVLAFAQRELAQARMPAEINRVRLAQQLLAQELRHSGPGNAAFVVELRAALRAAEAMTRRSASR